MILIASLGFSGPTLASDPATSNSSKPRWEAVSEVPLPASLAWSRDVRISGSSNEMLIVELHSGLYRWNPSVSEEPTKLVRRGNGRREMWMLYSLGVSDRYFAIAAPAFVFGWGQASGDRWEFDGLEAADGIMDLDIAGDSLVMMGARRNDAGDFAPDGAIAWMGSMAKNLEDLRPVLFSKDGPGADSMGRCGMIGIGAVRFLADGSFVIVPGVEDGVFHFKPDGQLETAWSSESVGFEGGCPLSDKEMYHLSADEPARWSWINGRRTVDEILPLAGGPGIVLRDVTPDGVRWRLAQRGPDGAWVAEDLPLTAPSKWAHVSGDVDGERLKLLVWAYGPRADGPEVAPRLVTLERR